MSDFWKDDPVVAAPPGAAGNFWEKDPVAAAPDIGAGRAGLAVAARGIPVGGAYTDKGIAYFNALAAKAGIDPGPGMAKEGTLAEMAAKNEASVKAAADAREREHPIESTLEKVGLGSAALAPAMMAAPAATGLAGTLGTMATRGALFNAGVGGVDAAARGEDVGKAALEGGLVGAALPVVARGAGKAIHAVKDWRNPAPVVPGNVERVGGADIPFHQTEDPAIEARKEIMRKGAAGSEAERIALAADEAAKKSIGHATENITNPMGLEPASASDAGAAVQSELAAREQSRQAADATPLDQRIDSLAAERSGLATEPYNGTPNAKVPDADLPLHKALSTAAAVGHNHDAAMGAARWGIENGRPDIAQALVDRAAKRAMEPVGRPGVAADHPKFDEISRNLQAIKDGHDRELEEIQAATGLRPAGLGLQVDAHGRSLARDLGGGAAPVSPFDAAESTGAAVAAKRDAAVAATRDAYKARDAVPGEFDPSVARGLSEDIRTRLNAGENPIWVDPTNESTANKALKLIDQTLGKDSGLFENAVAPKPAAMPPTETAAAAPDVGATVAALRAKFGDGVADAYANQVGKKAENPHSLLQFIASKGGIKPDQELNAIGLGPGHRVQIPGQPGFFSAVKKNGMELDRMREAAQEAGYFRGHGEATSAPTEFLDAIDAELRGQKRYPEGFEGHKTGREKTAMGAREQHEHDALHRGIEDDLAATGHGGLGPDVKERAVQLMRDEGMHPDEAVDHALSQLDQEDAARAAASAGPVPSDFPGDRAATPKPGADRPIDLKTMDEARKRLVTMYGDAKSAGLRTGDMSDTRAMGKILHEFDNAIGDALSSGKFSGDAALAKELQDKARASHAEYKQTFSAKLGDEIGRAVEKILGRYSDTAATAEDIQKLSYGPKGNPGTGNSVKVALRLKKILGENSPEFGRWKSGLFQYVDDRSLPVLERAQRIDEFLDTSLGRSGALQPQEVQAMRAYSKNLRASAPSKEPLTNLQQDIQRIAGTDGKRPATVDEVTKMLTEKTGNSQRLLVHLKQNLTPEGWDKVRRGVLDHVLNAPEGHNEFTALAKSKRLSDFLASGKADILLSANERAELGKLASVFKRMVPLPGTTNPSGTAPMLTKIAKKATGNLMTMLGLATHGPAGAITGYGLDRIGAALKDARAGKEAVRLFYGPQAKSAMPRIPRLPVAIGQAAIPASQR